jgi:hypothetical protein
VWVVPGIALVLLARLLLRAPAGQGEGL